jgi:GNAT superfamily N-acetyltransferase
MDVIIRKGKETDLPALLNLIFELAEFEKAPDAVTNTVEEMTRDGFGKNPAFEFFVAEYGNQVIGIALYFIKYSTWKGKGIYLDDLIVTEKFRGKGVGKKLFDQVIKVAKTINAKQLHWQVLDWNEAAIRFYKSYGASVDHEWLDCKLTEEQLKKTDAA